MSGSTELHVYGLIFNAVSKSLDALPGESWVPLSARRQIAHDVYEALRTGGLDVRFSSGYFQLGEVTP